METGPLQRYRAMVAAGEIASDPAQRLAAEKLERLAGRLADYRPPDRGTFLSRLTRRRAAAPPGLYIHGAVGRGKTMLMDLFFETVSFDARRRVHFHEFMAEVHERIARVREDHESDPVPKVAQAIASETPLLCFDELQVTDIADAMILGRLFAGLFEAHGVVVATSNTAPRELYRDGLNRPLFEPFIDLVETNMEVLPLDAATDYRLEQPRDEQLYFTPADETAAGAMRDAFERLAGQAEGAPARLAVKGRTVEIPEAAMGVARFDFADLCEQPLGAGDYLAIARAYHTLLIENIPVLDRTRRNAARRFVNLIDTLYDNGVRLVASAEAEPDALYREGDDAALFERAASRLIEMRSPAYPADPAAGDPATGSYSEPTGA